MAKKKRLSPFSKEFWINKGYSEAEADYKRNSIRPIKKEYWIERGYSIADAEIKATETKSINNKKGALISKNRSKEDIYKGSIRRKEYWIERGFTEDDAINKVKEIQATNSLENFIKRHGIDEGYEKWKERQLKWQTTLNNKSDEEKIIINKNRCSIDLRHYNTIDDAVEKLNKLRNMTLVNNVEAFKTQIINHAKDCPYILYMPFDVYIEKFVPKIQLDIFEKINQEYKHLEYLFKKTDLHFLSRGNRNVYRKWTKDGLLRSSYEIYFFETIKEKKPHININIDSPYPNSNMRYDFLIENKYYIEICPMIHNDEKYKQKMLMKKEVFGAILLSSVDEMNEFIEGL